MSNLDRDKLEFSYETGLVSVPAKGLLLQVWDWPGTQAECFAIELLSQVEGSIRHSDSDVCKMRNHFAVALLSKLPSWI